MSIKVHHLQVSQSERIVWLCEELGLKYDLVLHKRDPILSPPEIKALNPLGAAPVLEDTSTGTYIKIAESAAIVDWLSHTHANGKLFVKPGSTNYADFLYWWHTSNGTLQPAVSRVLALSRSGAPKDGPALQNYQGRLKLLLEHFDARLKDVPYLAGQELTVADVMSIFSFTTMRAFFGYSLEGYDGILQWLKRCTERPAYIKAREKGDPGTNGADFIKAESPEMFGPMKG